MGHSDFRNLPNDNNLLNDDNSPDDSNSSNDRLVPYQDIGEDKSNFMLIVFDGMDGAGKTTQIELFADWLSQKGHDVLRCRDPGDTEIGQRMRELLLGQHEIPIAMRTELLMFMAARAQLVDQIIEPALHAGKTVICDRYVFSTVVYQGYAGGIEPDSVWQLNQFAVNGRMADLTFLFVLNPETAMERLGASLDRMESRGLEFFRKLHDGFVQESKRWPQGVELVDGGESIEETQRRLRELAEPCLK